MCLRALEKIVHQLADLREQAESLSATALQPVDVNADGINVLGDNLLREKQVNDIFLFSPDVATDDLSKSAKKPKRGNTLFILRLV